MGLDAPHDDLGLSIVDARRVLQFQRRVGLRSVGECLTRIVTASSLTMQSQRGVWNKRGFSTPRRYAVGCIEDQ